MTAPTASTMIPYLVGGATMNWRESAFAEIHHFTYNEIGIIYNQPHFTYNYSEYRGMMEEQVVVGPTMEGRL